MCPFPSWKDLLSSYWKRGQQSEDRLASDGSPNVGQLQNLCVSNAGKVWKHRILQTSFRSERATGPLSRSWLLCSGLTYRDDDGGHESPAHLEEERRREAQHHLHVLKVVPVACDVKTGDPGKSAVGLKPQSQTRISTHVQER